MSNSDEYVFGVDLDDTGFMYHLGFKNLIIDGNNGLDEDDFPEMSDYCFVESKWPTIETIDDYRRTHIAGVENGLFKSLSVYEGFSETISMLRENGVIIRIITHRLFPGASYVKCISDTAEALEAEGIEYDEICFAKRKSDIRCDALVDDSPTNIKQWTENTKDMCFIFDQPYNRGIEGTRVKSWKELGKLVLEHKKSLGK